LLQLLTLRRLTKFSWPQSDARVSVRAHPVDVTDARQAPTSDPAGLKKNGPLMATPKSSEISGQPLAVAASGARRAQTLPVGPRQTDVRTQRGDAGWGLLIRLTRVSD
jgi:hypothetical protein